ncbi:hypothetical protein TYRP_018242 [Tyrophagus putrescentiae]|nr:hypothetical protein TYRP_018242 [Tyrophagus putrescentiae]
MTLPTFSHLRLPFRRCFHAYSAELFRRPERSLCFRRLYAFDLMIFAYGIARLGYVLWAMVLLPPSSPATLEYLCQQDPGLRFFASIDPFIAVFALVTGLFSVVAKTLLVRGVVSDTPTWRFWADLTVSLREAYERCRLGPEELAAAREHAAQRLQRRQQMGARVVGAFLKLLAPAVVWLRLENLYQERFYAQTRPFDLPDLDPECKRRAVQALIIPVMVWSVRETVFTGFSPAINLLMALECAVLVYDIFRFLPMAFFFTNTSVVAALVQGGHCRAIRRQFRQLATVCRGGGGDGGGACLAEKTTRRNQKRSRSYFYLHEALRQIMVGNRALWGPSMAAFVCTTPPLNIYALSLIVVTDASAMTAFEIVSLNITLPLQLVAFVVTMGLLSVTSKKVHSVQESIVALQPCLMGNRWLGLKLKLDCLKERLSTGPKVAITIGPAREVTAETLFEPLGLYFAYLFFVFSQQLEKKAAASAQQYLV